MEDEYIQRPEHEALMNQAEALFQSKRAKLKKQSTHMYGKYMIVKAENNVLRKRQKSQAKWTQDEDILIALVETKITTINAMKDKIMRVELAEEGKKQKIIELEDVIAIMKRLKTAQLEKIKELEAVCQPANA